MRKILAVILAITTIFGNSLIAFAAPETMPDGTVFDAEYYAETNSDVVLVLGADKNALYQHFKNFGQKEGRMPVAALQAAQAEMSLSNNAFQKNSGWRNLPQIIYIAEIEEIIDCSEKGNPITKYVYYPDFKNPLQHRYSYEYDSNGNLVTRHEYNYNKDGILRSENTMEFEYDSNGNLKTGYERSGDSSEKYVIFSLDYDTDGKLISAAYDCFDAVEAMTLEYDANGNLIRASGSESGHTAGVIYIFEYDENGRISTIYFDEDKHLYARYIYDENGKLTAKNRESYYNGTLGSCAVYANGLGQDETMRYEYDNSGKLITEYDDTLTQRRTYEYDTNGRIIKEFHFRYDYCVDYNLYEYASNTP